MDWAELALSLDICHILALCLPVTETSGRCRAKQTLKPKVFWLETLNALGTMNSNILKLGTALVGFQLKGVATLNTLGV